MLTLNNSSPNQSLLSDLMSFDYHEKQRIEFTNSAKALKSLSADLLSSTDRAQLSPASEHSIHRSLHYCNRIEILTGNILSRVEKLIFFIYCRTVWNEIMNASSFLPATTFNSIEFINGMTHLDLVIEENKHFSHKPIWEVVTGSSHINLTQKFFADRLASITKVFQTDNQECEKTANNNLHEQLKEHKKALSSFYKVLETDIRSMTIYKRMITTLIFCWTRKNISPNNTLESQLTLKTFLTSINDCLKIRKILDGITSEKNAGKEDPVKLKTVSDAVMLRMKSLENEASAIPAQRSYL